MKGKARRWSAPFLPPMGKPPHTLEEERRLPLLLRKEERQDEGSLVAFRVVVDGGQSPTDPAFHLESPVYTTPRYNSLPPMAKRETDRPTDVQHHTFFYNVKRGRERWPSSPSDQEKGGSVRPPGERWTADISREEKGARSSHQTFKILPLKRGG